MKKFKKLFAVLLSLTMVLGMTATVFATSGDDPQPPTGNGDTPTNPTHEYEVSIGNGTDKDKGTITVKGIEEGATVTAYQIIKASYENNYGGTNHFSGYTALYNAITVEDDQSASIDAETLTNVITEAGLTTNNPTLATGTSAITLNYSNGAYTASDLKVGSYLVMVTGGESKIYNPMVLSVSYVNLNGALNIESTELDITNPVGWAKSNDAPTIDKTSKKDGQVVQSVNIGDTVNYEIVVNPIPYYKGSNPIFNVEDTLSTGLTIDRDSVKVYLADSKEAAASATTEVPSSKYAVGGTGQTLTVDFVVNSQYQLNDDDYQVPGKTIVIRYNATVADKDAINYDPYTNTATLNYTKDSTLNGDEGKPDEDPKSKTYNYTFDLSGEAVGSKLTSLVTKTGETLAGQTDPVKLKGAEFTLYTDEACTTAAPINNDYIKNGVVTSGDDGVMVIRGLAAGTYYLKETKAPNGYSLNETAFKIEIDAVFFGPDVEGTTDENKGQLKSWTVKFNNEEKNLISGTVTFNGGTATSANVTPAPGGVDIPNTKLTNLPSTGGIGTTIFTIGGCALMILAAALYFATRRKTAK